MASLNFDRVRGDEGREEHDVHGLLPFFDCLKSIERGMGNKGGF